MMSEHHPSAEAHDAHELEHIRSHLKFYWAIFGALGMFTLLTVGVAYVDFGSHANNFAVGLLIATIKASLVAMFFMHLWGEKKLIYKILAFTVFFAFGLFALSLLAFFDHTHTL